MSDITWSDVTTLPNAPAAFASVSMDGQTAILALVNDYLDVSQFDGEDGPTVHLARCYLAAHYASIGPLGGILTGTREDDLEDTYALIPIPIARDSMMAFWFRSGFGAAFWALMNSSGARIGVPA